MTNGTWNLLERLMRELGYTQGCLYLSDMPHLVKDCPGELYRHIEQIPLEMYSLREWLDVAEYLLKTTPPAGTPEAVRAFLLKNLKEVVL